MASKNFAYAAGWSQSDQRDYAVFYDQHRSKEFPNGRPWWAVVERPSEGAAMAMPVGELQPGDGKAPAWVAPWYPDAKYMTKSIGRATPGSSMSEHRFRIDYATQIADRKVAMQEYYNRAVTEAIGLGWPAPDYGDPIGYKLQQVIGKPPLSSRIPEAALAEDPWILGFTTIENEALARLLELGHDNILTAKQSEAKVDKTADLEAKLLKMAEQLEQLTSKNKGGRPRKVSPAPV